MNQNQYIELNQQSNNLNRQQNNSNPNPRDRESPWSIKRILKLVW